MYANHRRCTVLAAALLAVVAALPLSSVRAADSPEALEASSLAKAYQSAVFMLNLVPVDWDLIRTSLEAETDGVSALNAIRADVGPAASAKISAALARRSPADLFAEATRAMAGSVQAHLDRAKGDGDTAAVAAARADFEAFRGFIEMADADAATALLAAFDTAAADAAKAGALADAVTGYLDANYLVAAFAPRTRYAPVPESRVLADPKAAEVVWLPLAANIEDQDPLPRLVLNFEQQGIDEKDLFLVAYGDMLFDSAEIFGEPARSLGLACSSCHNRGDINQAFFIPGISGGHGSADVDGHFFNARFNDRRADPLDIPSLRGIRFTGPYGRNGRFGSLRNFTRNVIVNEFAGDEPTPLMLDALVAYQFEFDFLPPQYVDGQGRLLPHAPEDAKRGEVVFNRPYAQMGDKACSSCHQPAGFFKDTNRYDIGSAEPGYDGGIDGGFETPTLLNTVYTAPYFHDGSLPTLGAVVAWFDERYALGLTAEERTELTAYLEAVGAAHEPYQAFDAENTPFRLAWEELSTFASTLATLIPAEDAFHASLMIRTVAGDLDAEAHEAASEPAMAEATALAAGLRAIDEAIGAGDWQRAATLWAAWQDRAGKADAQMR